MRSLLCAIFVGGLLLGCTHTEKRSTTQPSGDFRLGKREMPAPMEDTVVWSGSLPFLQIFAPGGTLQLVDLTDRVTIWSGQVAPNSLIRVDGVGVTVGSQRVLPRNLRMDHQYELRLKSTGSSGWSRFGS